MSQAPWAQRPPPPIAVGTTEAWDWELFTPAGLTTCRGRLRREVERGQWPAGADRDDVDRLLLAFEELASNGLRHGRAPVRVRVIATPQGWLIDVTDTALDQPPTPAVDRDPASGGLGLYLVARLCPAHGWSVLSGRKHVWACVRLA
jgi:signal transduction histidine kinase